MGAESAKNPVDLVANPDEADTGVLFLHYWNGTKFELRQTVFYPELNLNDQFGSPIVMSNTTVRHSHRMTDCVWPSWAKLG